MSRRDAAHTETSTLRLATFDVGKKNFAHYVEDVALAGPRSVFLVEEKYNTLPKARRRRVKGPVSPEMANVLEAVCLSGTTVHHGVVDLRADQTAKHLDLSTRDNLFVHLESLRALWDTCDVIAIEQQYFSTFTPKGRKGPKTEANIDAIKLAECCYAWFRLAYPDVEVMFYGAQFKTQILGAPDGLSKYQRKKWAVDKAKTVLALRGETGVLEQLHALKRVTKQKLDDVADCLVMAQALKFQRMVACT